METVICCFQCEGIVEDYEDDLLDLFAAPREGIVNELCHMRSKICSAENVGKDEL